VTIDWSGVPARLRRLGVKTDPPLTAADLAAAEEQFGVTLPAEYREFLLHVGAGGAGPDYGLYPLRHNGSGWQWGGAHDESRYTDLDRLAHPFETEPDWPPGYEELEGAEPAQSDFATPEAYEDAFQEWAGELVRMLREDPTRDHGATCLATAGCGYRTWLVVSGPAAGEIWHDARVDDHEMAPAKRPDGGVHTFGSWYLNWLEAAEAAHAPTR
jgi:SMI1 / KNR4 family (SUKH-1)